MLVSTLNVHLLVLTLTCQTASLRHFDIQLTIIIKLDCGPRYANLTPPLIFWLSTAFSWLLISLLFANF